jgi:hypothetical protein
LPDLWQNDIHDHAGEITPVMQGVLMSHQDRSFPPEASQKAARKEKSARAIQPAALRKEGFLVTPLPPGEGEAGTPGGGYVIRAADAGALKLAIEMTGQFYRSAVQKGTAAYSVQEVLKAMGSDSDAEVLQFRRNAEARFQFIEEFQTFTSKEVAGLAGSRANNQAALANRWKGEGRIFAVEWGGKTLFPAFQFRKEDSQPRPEIAKVLAALGASKISGWPTALWFTGRNGWLGGQRPVDRLEIAPDSVVEAALREGEAFD